MPTLHQNELTIDDHLVRELVARQFPCWTGLSLRRVESSGTVNVLYRLGTDLVVRLPRLPQWGGDIVHEVAWLPVLSRHVPLNVPRPVGLGEPTAGFPAHWGVFTWLDGRDAASAAPATTWAAGDLARFVIALRDVDPSGAPRAQPIARGGRLTLRNRQVQTSLAQLENEVESPPLADIWERAVKSCEAEFEPTWVHTDLLASNLLVEHQRIIAVIDFGSSRVGDPACDLTPAWTVFDEAAAARYLDIIGPSDAAVARARGWALDQALMALPYYRDTNRTMVAMARRTLEALTTRTP